MEVDRHAWGKWLEPVTVIPAEMMVFLRRDGGTQKTVIMHTIILIFQEWQKTDFAVTKIEVSPLALLIIIKLWASYSSSIYFTVSFLEMRRIPSRDSYSEEKRENVYTGAGHRAWHIDDNLITTSVKIIKHLLIYSHATPLSTYKVCESKLNFQPSAPKFDKLINM